MVTLTRRRVLQAGAVSGTLGVLPATSLLRGAEYVPALFPAGTTLEATLVRPGTGYRRMDHRPGWRTVVRSELAAPRRGREDRRQARATIVQVSDLHVTDVQNPMRFEYIDRINSTGHRPQELLNMHGTAALVRRINAIAAGPLTGRAPDAVITTGDNTDNQAGNELEWLLTLLAGGTVRPSSGTHDGFEGVACSGLTEYWQPEDERADRYKDHGFPHLPGLLDAATRAFDTPGLTVPWLLTMGNHDVVANGMLENRGYVEDWSTGDQKIFSAHCDATYQLAARLRDVRAFDDVSSLIRTVAGQGTTRTVAADPRRLPYSGAEFVAMLHEARFDGVGPVGHGFTAGSGSDQLYYTHVVAPGVAAISLDSTNQAGGIEGSIGRVQWEWLKTELKRLHDHYVLIFTHHPSDEMTNLAPDPRTPGQERHSGAELVHLLQGHPNVVAWVNGHTHHNKITAHAHPDARRAFWEINSASHVDAPQQARIIEVARNGDGTLSLFTTMIDADSPAVTRYDDHGPDGLASLYRELAYNDPSYRDRRGGPRDRNTELVLVDPLSGAYI